MSIGQFPSMANFILTVLEITEQDSVAVPSAGSIGRLCRSFSTATQNPAPSLLHGGTVRCSHPPFRRDQRQVMHCTWHRLAFFLLPAAVRARPHAVPVAALVRHVHLSPPPRSHIVLRTLFPPPPASRPSDLHVGSRRADCSRPVAGAPNSHVFRSCSMLLPESLSRRTRTFSCRVVLRYATHSLIAVSHDHP